MELQAALSLTLFISIASAINGNNEKIATSYSYFRRFDGPELKISEESISRLNPYQPSSRDYGLITANKEISNGRVTNDFEASKPDETILRQDSRLRIAEQAHPNYYSDFATKIQQKQYSESAPNGFVIQNIPSEYSDNQTPISQQTNSEISLSSRTPPASRAMYPSLMSVPIIQKGRLTTPGLSAFSSNYMLDEEIITPALPLPERHKESHVSFSGSESKYSW